MRMRNWLLLLTFCAALQSYGQDKTSKLDSVTRKNIIKLNITAPLLFGSGNYVIGYERVLKNNQSFSIVGGLRRIPKLVGVGVADSAYLVRNHSNTNGWSLALDYRFYFKNRNKRNAPDGVYIGPYLNLFQAGFKNELEIYKNNILDNKVEVNTDLGVRDIGIQVGYQFIIKNRFSIDMVFVGPSFSWYKASLNAKGILKPINEGEYYEVVKEKILAKYPHLEGVLDGETIEASGTFDTTSFGYRYVVKIGYAF